MKHLLAPLAAVLVALATAAALAALPQTQAVQQGAAYIRTTQQPDGGFGGFGPGQTMDAIYALRAAGIDPKTITTEGKSPADFLLANAAGATQPPIAAKFALAAVAMGLDPSDAGGIDLVARITGGYDASTGRYASDDFGHALAMLGLVGSGASVPPGALQALRDSQVADGGWGFDGVNGDPDITAMALQAVLAAGVPRTDPAAEAAIAYLRDTQGDDGGWGFDPSASNASSTAVVVQALLAAAENVESATYSKGGATPISFLLSQQAADGSFEGFDPAFATNLAVPALAGRTFLQAITTPLQAPPSPTATATAPAASPTVVATATPGPPQTGTGKAADGEARLLWLAGALLATAAATAIAFRKAR
jgi:hypothetical protein